MGIVWTLILGVVAGVLARLTIPGREPGGTLVTIAIGIAGALLAGFVGEAVGWYEVGDPPGLVVSALAAGALLAGYRALR